MSKEVQMPSVIPGVVATVVIATYLSRGDNLDRTVFRGDGDFGGALAMDTLVSLLPKVHPATYKYADLMGFGLVGGMYAYGLATSEKGYGRASSIQGLAGAVTGLALNSLILTPMMHKAAENRVARERSGQSPSSAATTAVPSTVFRLRK